MCLPMAGSKGIRMAPSMNGGGYAPDNEAVRVCSNSELDGIVQRLMSSVLPSFAAIQRRQRVHAAVRELLAEQGFRISMDAVAARAGCSKQTLYAQFGSKQALLRSMIDEHLDLTTVRLENDPGTDNDIRGTLLAFAVEHLAHLCDPSVVATSQLLTAEAHQFPEEAKALYRDGCERLTERLARWLASAMERGLLKRDDPHLAAELLLSMITGLDFERQRFAVPHRRSTAARRRWAEFAVDAFLRAFAPASEAAQAGNPSRPPQDFQI